MWKILARAMSSRALLAGVVRGIGGAALAGIGWKLGADAYDATKRRFQRTAPGEFEEEEEDLT